MGCPRLFYVDYADSADCPRLRRKYNRTTDWDGSFVIARPCLLEKLSIAKVFFSKQRGHTEGVLAVRDRGRVFD